MNSIAYVKSLKRTRPINNPGHQCIYRFFINQIWGKKWIDYHFVPDLALMNFYQDIEFPRIGLLSPEFPLMNHLHIRIDLCQKGNFIRF